MHKHHIVPKYAGGTDDATNIVILTVTQHAMWHFAEWQRKGNWQDRLAWRAISGIISQEEVIRASQSSFTRERGNLGGKYINYTPELLERKRQSMLGKNTGPRPKVTCPHCGKVGGTGVMHRWHFDNCRVSSK